VRTLAVRARRGSTFAGMTSVNSDTASGYLHESDCRLDDFIEIVEQTTELEDYPFAESIVQNVVSYDCDHLRSVCKEPGARRAVQAELNKAFLDGPGIVVFKRAYADTSIVDAVTVAFNSMIAEQHRLGMKSGDHYAKPGDNDRVWNALEKLAVDAPDEFVAYYANDIIHMASSAWLGPGFTLTSQVNVVNPGGAAQKPHRDYHLGFMTVDVAEEYPANVHHLSAALTLQGAIAHCDMPVESGPTMYLPNAQKYLYGYLAWWRPEFREYFEQHFVQLPLLKGDAVFFNPALFHAAGTNRTTDVHRMANLLQINSPLGKCLEAIDHERMCNAVYPSLLKLKASGASAQEVDNAIGAAANGYAFPTNLDRDQPLKGLTNDAQVDVVRRAVAEEWDAHQLSAELRDYANRRLTHGEISS
jgi:ectoine hydroxylase-related dioxygenase (phytanoyl-CoA dioxygenase family)